MRKLLRWLAIAAAACASLLLLFLVAVYQLSERRFQRRYAIDPAAVAVPEVANRSALRTSSSNPACLWMSLIAASFRLSIRYSPPCFISEEQEGTPSLSR